MGSHCRPAGNWMNISNDCCTCWVQSVVCHSFQQWSVEHSYTRRPGSGWPCSIDVRQDQCIVQTAMAARTISREEIQAPAVSPSTIGNSLLAAGLRSHVPLARLPLTSRHCQARLLWCRERSRLESGMALCCPLL